MAGNVNTAPSRITRRSASFWSLLIGGRPNKESGATNPTQAYIDRSGNVTAQQISGVAPVNTDATATGITLTAAKLVNGILSHAPTGAVNDATDTATNIVAQIPNCQVGSSFTFSLRNTSAGANTITVTAGTGVTLTGTMTVAQNQVRNFVGVVTAVGTPAVTLFSLGSGAF